MHCAYLSPEDLTGTSIIAVTGLAGHAIGSWSLPDGRMWLRDWLPRDARTTRILTYGYDARVQGRDLPTSTLGELAEQFLDRLIVMRDCTPQVSNKCVRSYRILEHSLTCNRGTSGIPTEITFPSSCTN
jgi:hypothetical protein